MTLTLAPSSQLQTATTVSPEQKQALLSEIVAFSTDCIRRYKFNNLWDVVLSVVGILLSVAVVAAGFLHQSEISAILGAIVGAVLTAQKAFPFGQRARFYRLLIGQGENLRTCFQQDFWTPQQAIGVLTTLRMDFAQELPRGTSAAQDSDPGSGAAVPTGSSNSKPPDSHGNGPVSLGGGPEISAQASPAAESTGRDLSPSSATGTDATRF